MAYHAFNAAAEKKIVLTDELSAIADKLAAQRLSRGEKILEATVGNALHAFAICGMAVDAVTGALNNGNFHQYSGSDGKTYMDGAAISTIMDRQLKSYFSKTLAQKLEAIGVEAFGQCKDYAGSPEIAAAKLILR